MSLRNRTARFAASLAFPIATSLLLLPLLRGQAPYAALSASMGLALLGFASTVTLIPMLGPIFVQRNLKGRDRLKENGSEIPESMGLVCASIYVLVMIVFIPFIFADVLKASNADAALERLVHGSFPHRELAVYLAALLCLLSATLLGFLDDLFDIRWRYKLPIPIFASIPLLVVYAAEEGNTHVVLPRFLRAVTEERIVNLGPLYYVYMSLLSTFCTNSINILAGFNGIEASQALVIAVSVAFNDLMYLPLPFSVHLHNLRVGGVYSAGMAWGSQALVERHLLSLFFMLPLIGVITGFLVHNWFPARAFPGDTLCYFAGMAFAVVGIIGHFSKTLLLFFLPQIFNFVLSCPQLFGVIPCPRHRMPIPGPEGEFETIRPSIVVLERPLGTVGNTILSFLSWLGLVRLKRSDEDGSIISTTNLTLPNAILVLRGRMSEQQLTIECAAVQIIGSIVGFGVRYGLAGLFYDRVVDDRR